MKLPNQPRLNPTGQTQVDSALNTMWQEIARAINNVSFGTSVGGPDNVSGSWADITTPAGANTEFSYAHNLNRVPQGWLVVSIDKAAIVYKGTTAWTDTLIYLKCNTSSTTIRLFIL